MAEENKFEFYLNQQGPRGRQGVKGDDGFSPIISVASQTATEYKLQITNVDGVFETPNLLPNILDAGGTVLQFDRENNQYFVGDLPRASEGVAGLVTKASEEEIRTLEETNSVISPIDVYTIAGNIIKPDSSNVHISIDEENKQIKISVDTPEEYNLPVAAVGVLGGIMPDNQTIVVDEDGTAHANLDEIGNELNRLSNKVNSIDDDVIALDGMLMEAQSDILALNDEMTDVHNVTNNLDTRVTNLEQKEIPDGVYTNTNLTSGTNVSFRKVGDITYIDATGGSEPVDAYTKEETDSLLAAKQNKLIAGSNITIDPETNVISSTGGEGPAVTPDNVTIHFDSTGKLGTTVDINNTQNRVEDLEETVASLQLYKFPNATIVGEPTINNGQISNFSTANYLQFPFEFETKGRTWLLNGSFDTGSNVTTQQNIIDSLAAVALAVRSGRLVLALSTNGTSFDLGEHLSMSDIEPNTKYYFRLSFSGTQYLLSLSTDKQEYLPEAVVSSTSPIASRPMTISSAGHPFSNIINLNDWDLTVADILVWQGMDDVGISSRLDVNASNLTETGKQVIRDLASEVSPQVPVATTEVAGIVKPDGTSITIDEDGTLHSQGGGGGSYTFTNGIEEKSGIVSIDKNNYSYRFSPEVKINGNPTITSDFVVSGFSDSNYLTMPCPLDGTEDSWEMIVPILSTDNSIANAGVIDSYTASFLNIRLTLNSGKPRFRVLNSLDTYSYLLDMEAVSTIQLNTKTYIKVEYSSSTGYKLSSSLDKQDWTVLAQNSTTTKILYRRNLVWYIGDNLGSTGCAFAGNIYANELSVKRNTDKAIKIANLYIGNYNYDNLDNIPTVDGIKVQGALTSSNLGLEKASAFIAPLKKEVDYITNYSGVGVTDTNVITTGRRTPFNQPAGNYSLKINNADTSSEITHNDGDNFLTFYNYVDVPFVANSTICGGAFSLVLNGQPAIRTRYFYGYYDANNHFIPKYYLVSYGTGSGNSYFVELDDENPTIETGSSGYMSYPSKTYWYANALINTYSSQDNYVVRNVGVYLGTTQDNKIQFKVIRDGRYASYTGTTTVTLDENKCKVCRICLNYDYSWSYVSRQINEFKVIDGVFTGTTAQDITAFMANKGTPISFSSIRNSKTILKYDNDTLKVNNQGQLYADTTNVQEALELLNGGETTLLSSKADVSLVNTKVDLPTATRASFPSSRFLEYELAASGSQYTIPAYGWLFFQRKAGAAGQGINMFGNTRIVSSCWAVFSGQTLQAWMPVQPGKVTVWYNASDDSTSNLFFVYANGAEEV